MQRKFERTTRKQKRRVLTAEASGDKEALSVAQTRLQRLRQEYSRFSKAAGLRTENERLHTAGFGRSSAASAVAGYKRVEKLANSMYDIGSTEKNVDAWLRDKPIRDKILAGKEYPATIESGQQRKHVPGTLEYSQYMAHYTKIGEFGPSRLTITEADAQALVYKYRGTGILPRGKAGNWLETEIITIHPEKVGVAVNNKTGAEADTTVFKIHYGKRGTHVVPDYPSKKGAKNRK